MEVCASQDDNQDTTPAPIKEDNIDDNSEGKTTFYVLVIMLEFLGLLCIVLVLVWTSKYLGGLEWDTASKHLFNYHPLFMVLGLVVMFGNSAVIYRVLRFTNKFTVKIIHGVLHVAAFIFSVLGLYAVFTFHNNSNIPNMYSLHSWFGIGTVVLFSCQLVVGCLGFLYPKFYDENRRLYLKIHVYFGGIILVLAVVSCISGITEKMLFMKSVFNYSDFPAAANVGNALGVCIGLFAMLVAYILYNPSYKRVEKYQHLN